MVSLHNIMIMLGLAQTSWQHACKAIQGLGPDCPNSCEADWAYDQFACQ